MLFDEWATAWGVPPEAVADLRRRIISADISGVSPRPKIRAGRLESAATDLVRLEASEHGKRLWRNNVGACVTDTGSYVRYGLANDSSRMNKSVKSSDLIGLQPVRIEQRHVGAVLGQFIAREMKRPGWVFRGTERELAQLRFLELINSLGGDACFCTGRGTL